MKKLFFFALAFSAFSTFATEFRDPLLLNYARRSLMVCPQGNVALETVPEQGPANFNIYRANLTSPDARCKSTVYELVSPRTGQMLMTDIFMIPFDGRSIDDRLTELTGRLLNKSVHAHVLPDSYPDGLRKIEIRTETPYGPFYYHAWLDASTRFMMSGRRGSLNEDPGKTYLAAVGAERAFPLTKTGSIDVLEISDLQCPTCKRAHEKMTEFLKTNGKSIRYARLDLPIFEHHDYAFEAAMGARAIARVAPMHYWSYVDFMFKNQEEITAKNFGETFRNFLSDHDIDEKKIQPAFRSKEDREELLRQVSRAYDNGIYATPTFIVNGQSVFYGNQADFVFQYITSLLPKGGAKPAAKAPAKPAAKPKK